MSQIGSIALLAGVYGLPAILLGVLLLRMPLHKISRRSYLIFQVLGSILCLAITYAGLFWIVSTMFYGIAEFYFDTTLGLVPGITRANIGQYDQAVILELSLRQGLPGWLSRGCFSADAMVCQLANAAAGIGSFGCFGPILLALALIPVLFSLAVVRRIKRSRAPAS